MTAIIKTYQSFSVNKFICIASYFWIQLLRYKHLTYIWYEVASRPTNGWYEHFLAFRLQSTRTNKVSATLLVRVDCSCNHTQSSAHNADYTWTSTYCSRILPPNYMIKKRTIPIYQNLFTDNLSVIRNIRKSPGLYAGPPPILFIFEVAEVSSFKLIPWAEVMWLFRFTFWMYPFWQIAQT